jgi:outer membrane protein OmpA-like peptidoglycan-associated protein
MTGLMMMFMLIAIIFMLRVEAEAEQLKAVMLRSEEQATQMKEVAVLYTDMREQLYEDLLKEFHDDLPKWGADLDRDLAIRFEEPSVLFRIGEAQLEPRFVQILDDFFPRYISILTGDRYRNSIEEVRIEGHTSTIWTAQTDPDTAYFKNMELSQERTRRTLEHVLLLPGVSGEKAWLVSKLTANGLSSSHPLFSSDGTEDRDRSQRVEFRVRTNAENRIGEIVKAAQK